MERAQRAPQRKSTPSGSVRGSADERAELNHAPQKFAGHAPGADRRDRNRDRRTPRRRRPAGRGRDRVSPRPTRRARGASKRSARRAPKPRAARNAARPPSAGSRDIEHEIRETFDIEPASRRPNSPSSRPAPNCRRSPRSRRSSTASAASASGSAPSICAPSRSCDEVEAQHQKLVSERDDLVEAIRRLRQGIHSLNHEARERLLASFATVNENFKKLFAELFGGGTAELQLIESDDPLEAGLEIMAKPPGKKTGDAVAALRRRAGAHRAGADLRRVPHQSGADLRARRGRRAARRL